MNFQNATYTCLLMTNVNCIEVISHSSDGPTILNFSVISIQEWYIHNKYPAANLWISFKQNGRPMYS